MPNGIEVVYCALIALALVLVSRGVKLPLRELLQVVQHNSTQAAWLAALGMVLAFLVKILT